MSEHRILAEDPRWREHQQAVGQHQAAERAWRERVAGRILPHEQAVREWEADARARILDGKEPTPRPKSPDLGLDADAAPLFESRRQQLHDAHPNVERETSLFGWRRPVNLDTLAL